MRIISGITSRIDLCKKAVLFERSGAASFFRFLYWFAYIFEGKFTAYSVGWKRAYLGRGSRVIGTKFIEVADGIYIGRFAWIEAVAEYGSQKFSPLIKIGQGFCASEHLHISSIARIEIGENCLVGSNVYISDHNHGIYKGRDQSHPNESPAMRKLLAGFVSIGDNVWIGDKVTIVGPVRIGNGAVIGANSVVNRDVSDGAVVAGVPAREIKRFNSNSNEWEKSVSADE